MHRRLPLLGAAAPETSLQPGARQPLGARSIGLADTGSGADAALLATELALVLRALTVPVSFRVLGYLGQPALGASLTERLAVAGVAPECAAIVADATPLPAWTTAAAGARDASLYVGQPALGSYVPALAILIGADRSRTSWPPVLRGVRASYQLELSRARPGLAASLASALIECGFLPRG